MPRSHEQGRRPFVMMSPAEDCVGRMDGFALSLPPNDARSAHVEVDARRVMMPQEAIALIESAVAAIESDRDRARQCLSRASALLRGEPVPAVDTSAPVGCRIAQGGLAQWQLRRVMAHIEDHISGPLRTRELAGTIGLSASHFFRRFKASIGTTPGVFVNRRRIGRACELMKTTRDPLCQIAIECGLCDQPHFTRLFRQIIGNTPSAWRRINALPDAHRINPRETPRSWSKMPPGARAPAEAP